MSYLIYFRSWTVGSIRLLASSLKKRLLASSLKERLLACMLCHTQDEPNLHLFTQCRYSLTIWKNIFNWVAARVPPKTDWTTFASIEDWWTAVGSMNGAPLKGWRSLIILVCWELWKERNARVFQRVFLQSGQQTRKMEEARCWVLWSQALESNHQFWEVIVQLVFFVHCFFLGPRPC